MIGSGMHEYLLASESFVFPFGMLELVCDSFASHTPLWLGDKNVEEE